MRAGRVLAHLELVAHDRHLAVEVLLRDERVHHAVGLEIERPAQVLVGRLEGLEVVRAIEPRACRSAARRATVSSCGMFAVLRRALEQQVLEQVRHARLAVALVARADQVGDVHGDRGLRLVGEQQHVQAVASAYSVMPSTDVTFTGGVAARGGADARLAAGAGGACGAVRAGAGACAHNGGPSSAVNRRTEASTSSHVQIPRAAPSPRRG